MYDPEKARQYYVKNRARILEAMRRHYRLHRDETLSRVKAYYSEHRQRRLDYQLARMKADPKKMADSVERVRAYHKKHPEINNKFRREHPAADRAHRAVRRAVAEGAIKAPPKCERCGKGVRLDAHHKDYSKPLDVAWLCRSCHKAAHRELRKKEVM